MNFSPILLIGGYTMLTLTISIPNNVRVYNRTRRMLSGDFSPVCQDSNMGESRSNLGGVWCLNN